MKKLICLYSTLLLLQSCSFYGVIGKNLDYILSDKIADMMDLYYRQEKELDKDIKNFLNTEKELFKEVRNILVDVKKEIKSGTTGQEKLLKIANDLQRVYIKGGKIIVPMLSKYYAQLDKEQLKTVFEKWDEENKKITKRLKKKSLSDHKRRFKTLLGDMNETQKKIIKKHKGLFVSRNEQRLARRLAVQAQLKKLMDGSGKNQDAIAEVILKSMKSTFNQADNKAYAAFFYDMQNQIPKEEKEEVLTKLSQVIAILDIVIKYKY